MSLTQILLIAASFAVYMQFGGPLFAAGIIAAIYCHEAGHLLAMKRYGMRTKGIYFIPLLGAVTVSYGRAPSRWADAVIAMMGPAFGLVSAVGLYAAALAYPAPLVVMIFKLSVIINLMNLMPIAMLDGGRVLDALTAFMPEGRRFGLRFAASACAVWMVYLIMPQLFMFMAVLGGLAVFREDVEARRETDRRRIIAALAREFATVPEPRAIVNGLQAAIDIAPGLPEIRAHATAVALAARKVYKGLFSEKSLTSERELAAEEDVPLNESSLGGYLLTEPLPPMRPSETRKTVAAYAVLAGALLFLLMR